MKKRSMLAIASFAVGVVASVATPTVQPASDGEATGDSRDARVGASAPDLALGASDAAADAGPGENGPRHA